MPHPIRSLKTKIAGLFIIAITAMINQAPGSACTDGCPGNGCSVASITFELPASSISADTLAGLIHSGAKFTLFECRSRKQHRDLKIPGAGVIYDDTSVASLAAGLPATDSLIILYPGIEGGNMASAAAELRNLGYLSILEYHAGVYGWITFGYEPEEGRTGR